MPAFTWHVKGTEIPSGTVLRPYEDHGVLEADNLPEACLQLINHELWWDTLDIEREVQIRITPQASGAASPTGT